MSRSSLSGGRSGLAGRLAFLLVATPFLAAVPSGVAAQTTQSVAAAVPSPTAPPPQDALLPEPGLLARGVRIVADRQGDGSGEPRTGFYVEFGGMITGAGWISAGPGYRQRLFGGRAVADASAAVSWRGYKTAQARFELRNLARRRVFAGSQILWQDFTQIHYYGMGPDSLEANRSEYRMKTLDVVGYVDLRAAPWLTLTGRVGRLAGPTISSPVGPFDRGYPDTRQVFPGDSVFQRREQPDFLHGGVSLTADTRDHGGHPTRGGLYRAAWSTYSDRDTGIFTFNRFEVEAVHVVPVVRELWVIALHGWGVASQTGAGHEVAFYLAPTLGGGNTLRGFSSYRFHDRNMAVLSAESRWALFRHVDVAFLIDHGGVAARIRDLDRGSTTWGAGLRLHSNRSTLLRFDVAHGREGWNFLLKLSEPFHVSRIKRRTAAIPFVP